MAALQASRSTSSHCNPVTLSVPISWKPAAFCRLLFFIATTLICALNLRAIIFRQQFNQMTDIVDKTLRLTQRHRRPLRRATFLDMDISFWREDSVGLHLR